MSFAQRAEFAAATQGTLPNVPSPSSTRNGAPPIRTNVSYAFGAVGLIALLLVILTVVILGTGIPTWIAAGRDTTPLVTLGNGTSPSCFCRGQPGMPGAQGPPGESIVGEQGRPGEPGPTGAPGICIADPTCASGATGPSGPSGASGASGRPGQTGKQGPSGPAGPSGPSGATGAKGDKGDKGDQGDRGFNGTCDCFDLPNVTIGNIVNTGTLNIEGDVQCGANVSFTESCFPNACLNFSACDLQARSLFLTRGSPTFFKVCSPEDLSNCQVILGDATTGNATQPDRLSLLRAYSLQTILDSDVLTRITTLMGDIVVQALGGLGSRLTLVSSGQVNVEAGSDVSIQSNGVGSVTLQTAFVNGRVNMFAQGGIFGVGETLNMTTQRYSIGSTSSDLFLAGTPTTLTCQSTLPLPVNVNGNKNELRQDMVTYDGAQILSGESSGIVSVGPYLSICGDRLISPGGTLTLQGNLFVDGTVSSTGACCTSDERMKQNVTRVDDEDMLRIVQSLNPVTFDWTDDFLLHDRKAQQRPSDVLGFIAQDVREVLPQAVTVMEEQRINGRVYHDFHTLDPHVMVPVNVGAIKALAKQLRQQQQEIKELRDIMMSYLMKQ